MSASTVGSLEEQSSDVYFDTLKGSPAHITCFFGCLGPFTPSVGASFRDLSLADNPQATTDEYLFLFSGAGFATPVLEVHMDLDLSPIKQLPQL